MAKLAKPKKIQRAEPVNAPVVILRPELPMAEPVEVVETPIAPQFEKAFNKIVSGELLITADQYKLIRLRMMRDTAKGTYSDVMLERVNDVHATKEFGSNNMEAPLRWLWDKYIGGKIGNQMVAEIIFSVLVQGVENGYKAIINWLRGKNTHVAEGLEDAIEVAGKVIESGKVADFKNEISTHLDVIRRLNEGDAAQGKKVGFFRKLLNVVKSIFGIN